MKLNNFSDNFKSTSAVRLLELFFIVLLLVVILYIRLYQLGADPPVGLSISTDVYTDPPQYTLFAKMFCQTGDFNLLNDYRFVFFIKSGVTALAVVVFKLLGVSLWSSNFVGLLYSLGALFLFFLFVRKQFGRLAGIFFLVLISSDFNHIFYGRLPFLEHAMAFYGFLSIVILCYFPNKMGTILAGVSLAVSIFFSKILGVIFLFPFFCYFVYSFQYEGRKNKLKTTGMFAIGFTIVTIFWLFYSYLPMKQRVSSYIQEQTISLYGFPEALESFSTFIFKLVSFGDRTMLFQRMKIPALLGTFLLGMILFHLAKGKPWKHRFGMFNSGHIFITTMIIAFYGSLMIWNYQPLRYQIILIYPFYGAAAVVLKMLWRKWQNTELEKVPYLFFLFCYPLVLVPLYQFYSYYIESTVGGFFFDDYIYSVAIGAFVLTAIIFVIITLFKKNKIPKKPVLGKILAAIIIGLVFQKGYTDYEFWWARPTFTIRDNSIDLGNILSPEAVLSGPFGSLLTLQNDLPGIIHMFGVSKADP
ncbi:MAG: hypothetical protein ACE5D6_08930, partial [Candidatus Zixiibacteriota bacterium]